MIRKCWHQFEPESRRILRSSALKATLLSPVFHLLLHPRAICVCAWLNLKRLGPKSEQSGDFVTEVIFTGFPSEGAGSPKFWTVDAHNTKTGMRYSLGSFTTLEEAVPVSGIDYKDQVRRVTGGLTMLKNPSTSPFRCITPDFLADFRLSVHLFRLRQP